MFWQRFYDLCISANSKPNPIVKRLGIASGSVTAWKSGTIPDREALVKISDFFDCSVDYLLGRTDNPKSHKCSASTVALGDISSNSGVIGGIANSAPVTINNGSAQLSENAAAMLEIFNTLDTVSQAELLVHANKLKNDNIRIVK